MSAEIRALKTLTDEDKASVIEVLEDALAAAKDGRLQSIALAGVRPDGAVITKWSANSNSAPIIGAIAYLQHDFIRSLAD